MFAQYAFSLLREKDLSEVLQIDEVFSNVSKGTVANGSDLKNAFGDKEKSEIIEIILKNGSVQVSEKERKVDLERTFKDIAQVIHAKCVNTETMRPFPVAIVETAMRDIHYSVKPNKSAKQQALSIIPQLSEILPISRSRMRLQINVPLRHAKDIKQILSQVEENIFIESEEWNADTLDIVVLADPGNYRRITDSVQECTKGHGKCDVTDLCADETDQDNLS